jgi:spore coat polysaccharide biosynthesis predicted glycosyltransferase SpsG
MKVFILTEGGKKIGFGHITRCISLYQAFEEKGTIPKFIVNGDDDILDLLKYKNYQIFNWLEEKNKLFKLVKNADVVVIDSYLADKSLYDKISELLNDRILVIIDDYNEIEYPRGIVIRPSIYRDKVYPRKDGMVYLSGKDYIILRKEFWDVPEKIINEEVKNVLITFGGIDNSKLIYKIVNYIKHRFDFNLDIVEPKRKGLEAKAMLNLMLKADICISGGGQTIYELARVGVPTIGICFAENQLINLNCWQKGGFIEYVGWYNQKHMLERLNKSLKRLLPYRERLKRSRIGKNTVDGSGAKRIIEFLLNKKETKIKLNSVKMDDCYDLFRWRNHIEIRRWCFNHEKINLKTHKRWFLSCLKNPMVKMFIAKQGKQKVGVIRFEENASKMLVNVNLNPQFLHRGIGTKLIQLGTEKILKTLKKRKPIIAMIKEDNYISQKAFSKAGYIMDRRFRRNKGWVVFVYRG